MELSGNYDLSNALIGDDLVRVVSSSTDTGQTPEYDILNCSYSNNPETIHVTLKPKSDNCYSFEDQFVYSGDKSSMPTVAGQKPDRMEYKNDTIEKDLIVKVDMELEKINSEPDSESLTVESSNDENGETSASEYNDASNSMIRNEDKFVDYIHPIYSSETKQLIDSSEIREKIKNHYIVNDSKKLQFICQIDHECFKYFGNDQIIENHIFSHFYFIVCPNCGKYYKLLYRLNRHLKTCKERAKSGTEACKAQRTLKQKIPSPPVNNEHSEWVANEISSFESGDEGKTNETEKSSSIDSIEMLQIPSPYPSINLNKQESELSHIDEYDDLTFPTYCCFNGYRVYSDEIKERTKKNYWVDYTNSLPYICKLDHNCAKCFSSSWHVENHVFSSFFFIQCPNCGKIFNFLYNGHKHIKICTEKFSIVDESPKWDETSNEKMHDFKELKSKRERSTLKYKKWAHPVYSWDTKQKVTSHTMRSMVRSSYIKYKNTKMPFICKLDHDCPKSFRGKKDVELHVFDHFFFIPCPNCAVIFKDYLLMTRHLDMCGKQQPSISENSRSNVIIGPPFLERNDLDKENRSDDSSTQRSTSSNDEFDIWIHPVYSATSNSRVFPNEIVAKIRENYNTDRDQTQPYICQIDHECCKKFTSVKDVEDHLFFHLFYTLCPSCERIFKSYDKLNQHLLKCKLRDVNSAKRPVDRSKETEPKLKKMKILSPTSDHSQSNLTT